MSEKATVAFVPAMERLGDLHGTYHDSMRTLREEKQRLRGVKRAIGRQVTPLVPFRQYFRRDWTQLSDLMDTQIEVVAVIADTLQDMATSCAEDRETLLAYVTALEERVVGCQEQAGTLGKTLVRMPENKQAGLLERITHGLKVMDLEHEKQRATYRVTNGHHYLEESAFLLQIAAQAHHLFSGAAETAQDRRAHLEATSQTCTKLITLGRTSAMTREILQTVDRNSQAVYTDLHKGVENIQGFFRKLTTTGYRPSRLKIRVQTKTKKTI